MFSIVGVPLPPPHPPRAPMCALPNAADRLCEDCEEGGGDTPSAFKSQLGL
jgi:hypothetical protein